VFGLPLPARLATVAAFGYAVGCLNAAYYIVRLRRGDDIRDHHTGNAGATNAGRVMGRRGFVVVLLFDAAKGAAATLLGAALAGDAGAAIGGVMAAVGHVWPVQLGWRGGMGVATLIGVVAALDLPVGLAGVAIFVTGYALSRRYVASGLIAIVTSPFVAFVLGRTAPVVAALACLVVIVGYTHRFDTRAAFAPRGDP
jgi:glycerol-3-phosphate acyltransferase PlsY